MAGLADDLSGPARVALATAAAWPGLDADDHPLLDALRDAGVDATIEVWDDPAVDWASHDAVVVRTTWDYTARREHFVAWAEAVESVTRLWNPAALIRWNTHKRYLDDLARRGVATVPTAWIDGRTGHLSDLLRRWPRAVVKPAVSAGARDTVLVDAADGRSVEAAARLVARLRQRGELMVQPYLDSIETAGELSAVFIDGRFSHAVRKRPPAGDFRVQGEGAVWERVRPTGDEQQTALRALAATPGDTLYARVDLLPGPDGAPLLVELEVVEPSLYLRHAPGAAGRLAAAIVRNVG